MGMDTNGWDFSLQVSGGGLTAETAKELEELRTKFGLSKESAQKIIKGAQNQQLISNMNVSTTSDPFHHISKLLL